MAIDVVMPQMGESIAEGTVVRWIKKPGDKVDRDEPLLEISTDKVDAEIPSPAAGTLSEVLVKEGQTVAVNSVVARIAGEGESAKPAPAPTPKPVPAPEPPKTAAPAPPSATENRPPATEKVASLEERRRTIAAENNVDIAQVQGSGVSGRVTKNDILGYIQQPATTPQTPKSEFKSGESIRLEPLSVMRKRIAQHMVMSKQTSAHVTTVFEIDFTNIEKLRQQYKNDYAARGAKLTYLPFIVQAIIAGLRDFPIINASMDENNIIYHRDYNIGIAVALEWGLIVPVVKNADEKNILGLAKTINELGERARNKKLSPDDVQNGTFTITNPGVYGGLFGTPIINQPQVAILGVGGVKKRPVVVETDDGDFIAIRSMGILSLTFDHRLIDGAVADQFMAMVKSVLEAGQFTV